MEFWGVEVKAGEPLKVTPNPGTIIHLSQAALGEFKKGSDSVLLSVKVGNQKIVLGTLSGERFPQLSFDVVFETEFELSHNCKNGNVYLCGYQTPLQDDDDDMYDSEDEEDELPMMSADNGKIEPKVEKAKPATVVKPKATIVEPGKAAKAEDDSDEDDDSEDDNGSDDDNESDGEDDSEEGMSVDEDDDEDDDEDEDEDEDKETSEKVESGKKRVNDSAAKTPVPSKKAKADTPQKTDGKKGVHTATPYPAKNAGKNAANGNKQTPKLGGEFSCKPCNKKFGSDSALQSHNKAKHSGSGK